MDILLNALRKDFPELVFAPGRVFSWSPKQQTVIYAQGIADQTHAAWSLLHEVGHALLQHTTYTNDLELVQMEAAAWQKAKVLATQYGHAIDTDHIQDCLDTYRDWLHQRSTCPTCGTVSLQETPRSYCCYNCHATWHVSRSQICRPYRRLVMAKN